MPPHLPLETLILIFIIMCKCPPGLAPFGFFNLHVFEFVLDRYVSEGFNGNAPLNGKAKAVLTSVIALGAVTTQK